MSARVVVREGGLWVGLASIAWWLPAVIGRSAPLFGDLGSHHYPWRAWVARVWAGGALPVWAPVGLGTPLLADGRAGVFYPPTLFVYGLFSEPVAFGVGIALHHGLAALGAYYLTRIQGRSASAGVLAAAIWALGGAMMGRLETLPAFEALAWLPWAVAFAIRGASGDVRGGALAGLVLGCVGLTGDPGAALTVAACALLLGAWFGIETRASRVLPAPLVPSWAGLVGSAALAAGIAAAIALPQLIATGELVAEVSVTWGTRGPGALLGALLPAASLAGAGVGYLGPAALLVAGLAGTLRRARPWWALGGLALALAVAPLPVPTPPLAGGPIGALPFGAVVAFAASQLAAIGLDRLAGRLRAKKVGWTGEVLAVVAVVAWLGVGLGYAIAGGSPETAPWSSLVWMPFGIGLLVASVVRSGGTGRLPPPVVLRLVVLGVVSDLAPLAWFVSPTSDVTAAVVRPPATVPSLGVSGGFRSAILDRADDGGFPAPSRGLLWGLDDVAFPAAAPRAEIDAWNDASGLGFGAGSDALVAAYRDHRALARVSGVRWIYTRRALDLPDLRLVWSAPDGDGVARVYEDPGAMPRAWFVGCARVASDPVAAVAAIDPAAEAIVGSGGTAGCTPGPAGVVTLRAPAPGQILAMDVDAARDGWLVIAESRWPGQRLVIDDRDVTAVPTDGPFQGIALAAGQHDVQLAYAPMWLFLATRLSSLVSIGAVLGLVLLRPGPRRDAPAPTG